MGGEKVTSSGLKWSRGALQLLLAAASIAQSAGNELIIYENGNKCEYEYNDVGRQEPPVRVVETIIIGLLCAVVVLQWRLMAAWTRENAIKKEMSDMSAEADISMRSKGSQSQVAYLMDGAQPRFQPLNESLQG